VSPRKLIAVQELQGFGDQVRQLGRSVVWTNGCFDLLHLGHVRSLQAARELGDMLIVGINSDASVERLKGLHRPIFSADKRAEMLAALACVDRVVIFDELTPEYVLRLLRPAIHCKGEDYNRGDGRLIPEANLVESYGGKVVYLPLIAELSTSALIGRIREMST